MTWKSTAFVSGAGLLATWLANMPAPSSAPAAAPVAQAAVAASAPAPAPSQSSDIAQLADRLERHNRAEGGFDHPARNLFKFGARPAPPRARVAAATLPDVVIPPQPPPLAIRLSGVAMDRVGEKDVWTAILSTPSGVVLAREGDDLPSGVKVSAIGAESVSLTRADGSVVTVPLSGK